MTLQDHADEARSAGYLIAVYQYGKRITYDLSDLDQITGCTAKETGFYCPEDGKYNGRTYHFILHNTYHLPYRLPAVN